MEHVERWEKAKELLAQTTAETSTSQIYYLLIAADDKVDVVKAALEYQVVGGNAMKEIMALHVYRADR